MVDHICTLIPTINAEYVRYIYIYTYIYIYLICAKICLNVSQYDVSILKLTYSFIIYQQIAADIS